MPTLRDSLHQNLHARLVGREAERARFADALTAPALPFHVAHVYGPGGVGKSTLLREFERLATAAGVPAALVDLRDVGQTPDVLGRALDAALARADELGPGGDGRADGPPAPPDRRVLLLDTFEAAQELDGWLQRVFLPAQSDGLLTVVAGRHTPAPAWTADVAWAGAVEAMPLGNLSDTEAEAFLDRRHVPPAARADVLTFTHGHPLALALVAERFRQAPDQPFVPAEAPDIVRALFERFVHDVPSAAHRTAVEGAAVVRTLSEPLLAALLAGEADAHALFGWLRTLPFAADGARGLVLHDLARETIEADLRWRDPDRHAALHARARRHYTSRLLAPGTDPAPVLGDYVHLYRDNPVVQPLLGPLAGAWRSADVLPPRPMAPADAPALVALVTRHEGEGSARIAARWFAQQPEATEVFDAADGSVAGFLTTLALDESTPADRAADVLASRAWAAAEPTRRPGERVLLFRFWMDAHAYQDLSAVQSLIFAQTVRHYLTTPHLGVSLLPVADADAWGPVLAFAGLARWPEADTTVDGRAFAVFGMDWRAIPPAAWLDGLAERVPHVVPEPPLRRPAGGRAVLSQEAFGEAVHEALRQAARPHRLVGSPLLHTRLVEAAAGTGADEGERVAALVALLQASADALQATPREAALWRALQLTYFKPAPSQALAAERLDVPFSTYRRHLGRGVAHVVEALWRQETGG